MALENIAWSITGGIVSASLARMLAFQATGGEEGVAGIGDFGVRQAAVAGASIRISNGGAVLVSRYPGVKNESYMVRAGDETVVSYPANNTGSTRYDLVVVRVDDWNFPGQQAQPGTLPTNAIATAKFQVITGVPSTTKTASQLGLGYPAVALARVAVPASTSTITQAMITDVREKAVPRRKRDLRALSVITGGEDTIDVTSAYPSGGEYWPDQGWTVEIPSWATQVRLVANWGGVLFGPGGSYGFIWARIGANRPDVLNCQRSQFDSTATSSGDYSRLTLTVADTMEIPPSMRGQSVLVALMGSSAVTFPVGRRAKLDASSSVYFDMEFIEAASEDY